MVYRSPSLHVQFVQKRIWEFGVLVALGWAWGPVRVRCGRGEISTGTTASWAPTPWQQQAPDNRRPRRVAAPLEERGKGGGTGRQACLAGKGEGKAREPRFTGKIYWADQMHRGG